MSRLNFNFTRRVSDVTKKYYRAILQETIIFNIKFEIKHIKLNLNAFSSSSIISVMRAGTGDHFLILIAANFSKENSLTHSLAKFVREKYTKIHLGKILMKIEHKNYHLRQSCNT